ncbi:hypothetical protein [Microbacterium sp. GCS4]|uniref:hypothetical protein n=1 Tax=Microbacterium sp. GCS4 TaxID=1692239 RepID=UPI001F2A2E55|nr:hypothetical protein [Microbacterium sp. GCS4]
MPRILATFVAVTALVVGVMVPVASAQATASSAGKGVQTMQAKMSLAGFDPGNIISDAVFTNRNTMSEAQIQSFFNGKVSRCQGGSDQWGPIICLKDFTITSVNRPADRYCQGYTGAPNESAARIIYRVAQSCGINPQVLIVMLQKEQGLVTHTWPSMNRYNAALGQGCPDGGVPCDPTYVGFFHQIYGAARQMQIYMEGRYFTYYAPGNTWNILYNPNRACGSSPVYVANKATSALYYYTPYQPNAAAMRAGYGEGDGCSAYGNRNFYNYFTDWFGPTQGPKDDPIGVVESIESLPGEFRVRGWALDPNSSESIGVHIYVGNAGYAYAADGNRPDVGAAYPGKGNAHGFDVRIPATSSGAVRICAYGINVGAGGNSTLRCEEVIGMTGSPVGVLETTVGVDGGVDVKGWALDPDTASSIGVHVYVGSTATAFVASRTREDVAAHYPQHGAAHGFGAKVSAPPGTHTVCAYGINVGRGANALLGCATVTVPSSTDSGRVPLGHVESMAPGPGGISIAGWAYDPDTTDSIAIRVTLDGVAKNYRADKDRPDFGAAYPAMGSRHGFAEWLPATVGTHEVCVYAVNNGKGGDTLVVCSSVKVTSPPDQGRLPVGFVESLVPGAGGATVAGWAFDPDTTDPISVHIYVDGVGKGYLADKERADVATAYPGTGQRSGFKEFIPMSLGTHQVCVYAINNGTGGNPLLSCSSVKVTSTVDQGRVPVAFVESMVAANGGATITGWAFDPDTSDPIQVHVYVNGVGKSLVADRERPDVGKAYPAMGSKHGFSEFISMPAGNNQVCVYAINTGAGGNPLVLCSTVKVSVTAPVDRGRAPIGFVETFTPSAGGTTLTGWAFDPDTTDPIQVHVYVNGVGSSFLADLDRIDIGAAYPSVGSRHGFHQFVAMPSGVNQVCVYAINTGAGGNPLIVCSTVRVP